MSKIKTLMRLLKKDKSQIKIALYNNLVHFGITNFLSDETYLKLTYKIRFNKKLNLEKPKSFNEKLQWLKLYDRNERYVNMVDKVLVKDYVSEELGSDIIVPTLGVYDKFEDINFESLPNKFVIKCNHDSGSIVICKDKGNFDKKKAAKIINKGLKNESFYWGREWPYKNVNKKIIIEEYLEDEENNDLKDYKLMCFNGKVKCSFVCSDRFNEDGLKVTFYDKNWNIMPFERHYPKSNHVIKKPKQYDKMVKFAEILSKDIPFVRIDFYEIKGKIYFGEITFYPGSGWEEFKPYEWDLELGSWIKL